MSRRLRRPGVSIPSTEVRFYHAPGCHLCEVARATVAGLRGELAFDLVEIDISGDPELELRYRPWLPVVEIDGEWAFYFTVPADELRRRIADTKSATKPRV